MTKILTYSVLMALCSPVMAQTTFEPRNYTSLGVSMLRNDTVAAPKDVKMTGVMLGFGREFTPWYSLEGRLGSSISGGEVKSAYDESGEVVSVSNLEMKLDHIGGIYNKINLSPGGRVSPYVLAGYSIAKATMSSPRVSRSSSRRDFTFGVGVDACGSHRCVRLELTRYLDSSKSTLDAFTASVAFPL